MRRFLRTLPLMLAAILVLAGCGAFAGPKLETVTGSIIKTDNVVHTVQNYEEWSAGVSLEDGTRIVLKATSVDNLNETVLKGDCVQFVREAGAKTVDIYDFDDIKHVDKGLCAWAA